jgi:hypothetical protein
LKKHKYYFLCNEDKEAISAMVNEEVGIDTDDEIDLEIEGEPAGEKSIDAQSDSE